MAAESPLASLPVHESTYWVPIAGEGESTRGIVEERSHNATVCPVLWEGSFRGALPALTREVTTVCRRDDSPEIGLESQARHGRQQK